MENTKLALLQEALQIYLKLKIIVKEITTINLWTWEKIEINQNEILEFIKQNENKK